MSKSSQYPELLKHYYIRPGDSSIEHTHTRIGDSALKVKGGKYIIPEDSINEFYDQYHDYVFLKKRHEYLTEKQLDDNGPLLVDFDFRYPPNVRSRQHTHDHIFDIIHAYLEKLKDMLQFKEKCEFPVFISEKDKVNAKDNVTKDGIHMVIGIQVRRQLQILLRENVKNDLTNIMRKWI